MNSNIIKYLELIDDNIIIINNHINIIENTNYQINNINIIKDVFKSNINILKTIYNIINKKKEFIDYHEGLLCEIKLLIKNQTNYEAINDTIKFINLSKYFINLTNILKKIIMPIEEIVVLYPELLSLAKFHNMNFYKLFIIANKIEKNFPNDENMFITKDKHINYLIKKYNDDLLKIIFNLTDNNFVHIKKKDEYLEIIFNHYRFDPLLLNLEQIKIEIYKNVNSIYKLKVNFNKLKEQISYIASVLCNLNYSLN